MKNKLNEVEWRLGCELKNKDKLCPYFYEFYPLESIPKELIDSHPVCQFCGGKIIRAVPVEYDD